MASEKPDRWLEAAELSLHSATTTQRVVRAGEFLEKTCSLPEDEACQILPSIDFLQPITIVRLPDAIYVHCADQYRRAWFTSTGLTAEFLRQTHGPRTRPLFRPLGNIPALKAAARTLKDTWEPRLLFRSMPPRLRDQVCRGSQGGGDQFIVLNTTRMRGV